MILLGLASFKLAGKFLKHALGLLILCWRRMLWAAGIAALIGVVGTEVLVCLTTGQFPPPVLAQLVAAALALALAYSAAMTVLIFELFNSMLDTIRLLMGEAEAGVRAATVVTAALEHEAWDLRDSLRRLIGVRAKPPSAKAAVAVVATALPALAARAGQRRVLTNPRPAEDYAPPSPPLIPRPIAQPVPASQLPRIAWSYDEPVHAPPPPLAAPTMQAAVPAPPEVLEPTPINPPPEEIAAASVHTLPPEEKRELPTPAGEDDDAPKRRVTSSVATAQLFSEPWRPPIEPERIQPRPTQPLGSTTRPLGSTTRPLGRVTRPLTEANRLREARDSGGLWDRLSQALVGSHDEPGERRESEAPSVPLNSASPALEQDS